MADTPQYERNTPIKPAQAVQGFAEGATQAGAFGSNMAQIGASLAQQSANKYAQIKGIEAAQTSLTTGKPNLGASIPLTEADKHFTEAYKQEIGQELSYQGNKTIQDLQMTAIRNPTSQSLADFEDLSKQTINEVISKAPSELKGPLRRSLEENYLAARNRMVLQLDKQNREYLAAKQRVQDDQQGKLISNSALEGNVSAATQAYDDRMETIAQRERIYTNTGGLEGYDPAQAEVERQLAKNKLEVAGLQYGYVQAIKNKKGAEYLKELREKRPEGMTPSEHDSAIKSVIAYGNEYQAALQSQQNINYLNYATRVDTGKMTESDLIQAKRDISETQFAQLERYIATRQNAANKITQTYAEAAPHFSDAGFMSRYSPEQINGIFSKHVALYNNAMSEKTGEPYEATLGEKAMLAQGINAPIPVLQKELSRAANYGTPEQALEAVRSMEMLNNNNLGVTLSGMSDNDKAVLNAFKNLRNDTTYSPTESLKLAREQVNIDEDTKLSRLKKWKDIQNEKDYYKNTDAKIKRIGDKIGAKRGWFRERNLVPTGLDVSFDRIMNRLIPLYAHPEDAEDEAFRQMALVNKPTAINNRNELMKFAPSPLIWNDRYRALKEFVDQNKEQRANGGYVMNQLDWPDAPNIESLYDEEPRKSDLVIQVDGKPRKIIVSADLTTQWGVDMVPSYAFSYLDEDGVPQALMDLKTGQQARWVPDFARIESRLQAKIKTPDQLKIEAIEEAHRQQLKALSDESIEDTGRYDPMVGGLL